MVEVESDMREKKLKKKVTLAFLKGVFGWRVLEGRRGNMLIFICLVHFLEGREEEQNLS
jgi:hypothetical protein